MRGMGPQSGSVSGADTTAWIGGGGLDRDLFYENAWQIHVRLY